jgi:hypothetical protein
LKPRRQGEYTSRGLLMLATRRCAAVAILTFPLTLGVGAEANGQRAGAPSIKGVFQPVVGHGAAYNIQQEDGRKSSMELAVVDKDATGGAEGYWIEMSFEGPSGEMIMKSLTVMQSDNVVVSRMILQMPGKPPMEFPQAFLNKSNPPRPADMKSNSEDLGSETITVPAGTFKCEHYRAKDGSSEAWVAREVSPWGLVKSEEKGSTIVLTRVISDAKDKITGTPVPFNPMILGGPPSQ